MAKSTAPDPPEPNRAGELAAVDRIAARTGAAPRGEVWIGDDAAVLDLSAITEGLFASDALVEDVHFARALSSLFDVGWKALSANVSDIAAMGGRPRAAVVALCGATGPEVDALHEGILAAGARYDCPVVGGDLTAGPCLVVSIALLGATGATPAVRRSGGRPGDHLFVTGALGGAAAGLRALRADPSAAGSHVDHHRRPVARLEEGTAAALGGATAMIDVSDGLGIDLDRLARASGVGVRLERVPTAEHAGEEEALSGGDDYELLFAAPDGGRIAEAFAGRGLRPPIRIGELTADRAERELRGAALPLDGYLHDLGARGA